MDIITKLINLITGRSSSRNPFPKPDLSRLLDSDDINSSIIELDNYLSGLCDFGTHTERLNEHQKVFYFNQCLEREVNNGGFEQFYFNISGNFAHELTASLTAIGAIKTCQIVVEANNVFPEHKVPESQNARQELMSMIEESVGGTWAELDQRFYAYEEDLNAMNMQYVRDHADAFSF